MLAAISHSFMSHDRDELINQMMAITGIESIDQVISILEVGLVKESGVGWLTKE